MTEIFGKVIAVSAGTAGSVAGLGRRHITAFGKMPMDGPVEIGMLGVTGDEHVYPLHGGPDQALLVYSTDHRPFWEEQGFDLGIPAFAENLTVEGLTEMEVHIGDTFEIGSVVAQVTSPRQPCFKIGVRHGNRDLPRVMQETGRVGYLLRVLSEGTIAAGDTMRLVDRPADSVSLFEASRVVNLDRADWDAVERLIGVPALAGAMREMLQGRLADRDPGDDQPRLYGEGEGEPA